MIIIAKYESRCPTCGQRVALGARVEWERGTPARHETCPAAGAAPAPRKAAPRAPRLPALTGVRGELNSQFEASKHNRSPHREVGESCWLRHRKAVLAVVVVGWEPAAWLSSDTAEDMGHYGVRSGYYGTLYYRRATAAEFDALQARLPRPEAERPTEALAEVAS